jgi:PAS domain S-box-containing protein
LIVVCLALCAFLLYRQQERTILGEHGENLQSVAQLKTGQLLAWRQERLADVRMHASGLVRSHSLQWLNSPSPEILEEIRQRLSFFQENEGYSNMFVVDRTGNILLTLKPRVTALEPLEYGLISQVVATGKPALSDFFFCDNCKEIHLEVAAPIVKGEQTDLILVLVSDPHQDLYPMLQSWPTSDSSAETMLVRKEGEHVVFLSPLRHLSQPPLSLRLPATNTENPAVQAVSGITGIVRGQDYRNEEVLAFLSPIPDTGWYMVAKMDTGPLLTETRFRAGAVLMLIILATAVAAALVQLASLSRRKALSEALLQEEQKHQQTRGENRAILYSIGEGIIATDLAGAVKRMNREAEALTGWQEADALGLPLTTIYKVVDEETGQPVVSSIERVLLDGYTIGMSNHIMLIAKDGSRRPVADSFAPIRSEVDQVTGAVLVFRDQTKRRAIEKARAESARRYADLVESISDFIWETGPDNMYSFASTRSFDLLGYVPEEIVGKSWFDFLSAADEPPERIVRFTKVLAQRLPYTQFSRTFLRKDGRPVVLECSATPVFDENGQFLGYRGVSRDITERRNAEEEQKRLGAQLLQSQKMEMVGRLAGGVAHDFNNMLTIISSYVEMTLNELNEDHRWYKRFREIQHATLHSADLTRQLLAFARKQVVAPKQLNINNEITSTLKMLQRLIGENIDLIWKPCPGQEYVFMDSGQLGQVFANLAVNARDAIAGTGNLVIATSITQVEDQDRTKLDLAPGRYVLTTFCDDGCGMDRETLAKIFEPFFTTKEEGQGTGLGLATVYGIMKQNNGAVRVASASDSGTTFYLYLPSTEAEELDTSLTPSTLVDTGSETILLVEDETAILEVGVHILEKRGYQVLTAATPSQALERAESYPHPIDLLITDVIMPELNGQQLSEAIRQLRPDIKVLFISGYTADIISHHGVLLPGINFLEKPFSGRQLGRKVREVLDQPECQNRSVGA